MPICVRIELNPEWCSPLFEGGWGGFALRAIYLCDWSTKNKFPLTQLEKGGILLGVSGAALVNSDVI
jgi:hypothetical protein